MKIIRPTVDPSPAQKEAGNYSKRKIAWKGMTISIENEVGSRRHGKNRDGTEWEQYITTPYGYLRLTEGVDGDHVDCFAGPDLEGAPTVFVVHARKYGRWDEYDEDKCMLGFHSVDDARQAFLNNYSDPRFLGDITEMPVDEFVAKARATKDKPAMVKAEQLSLFDAPVRVHGAVKKDGTVVRPYIRIQKKKAPEPEHHHASAPAVPPADALVEKKPTAASAAKEPAATTASRNLTPSEGGDKKGHHLTHHDAKQQSAPPAQRPQVADHASPPTGGLAENSRPEPKPRPPPREDMGAPERVWKLGQFGAAGESKARRREINASVVALLASGKTDYSAEDKSLLAAYSGNGGCGDSLNEFYTDPKVAEAIWRIVERNVPALTALEPSCGTGVFLHTAPADIKMTGVELDPVSAKAAAILHPNQEVRTSSLERFATSDERVFDAVVGNAPFGIRGGTIKDDKPDVTRADTYFLDAGLDKLRHGGVVAMIVHHGFLDSARDRAMRLRLLTKGVFLGALRLPNTAFEHSHTDVTSDIVFFKKRPQDVANALGVLSQEQLRTLGVWDEDYLSGDYFGGRGAPNVMGSIEPGWRAKAGMGNDITVAGSMQGVPEQIAAWDGDDFEQARPTMEDILKFAGDDERLRARILGAALKKPYELTKVGSRKTVDGVEYVLEGEPPRWHRVDEVLSAPAAADADDLAHDIDRLLAGDDSGREGLAARVRSYIERYGVPSKNLDLEAAARQNKVLYRLIGAVHDDGSLSDIFDKKKAPKLSSFQEATETLALEGVAFTPEQIAERTGQPVDAIEDLLHASSEFARLPEGGWTRMPQYLSGELWPKLDAIETALARTDLDPSIREKYQAQATALEAAIAPKSLEDVDLAVNHAFIPFEVVASFLNDRKSASEHEWVRVQPDFEMSFDEGIYHVRGGDMHTRDLIDRYLNRTGVKKEEWEAVEKLNRDFKAWVLGSRFRDELETLYNRKFRGYIAPEYSKEPIKIEGMRGEGIKDYVYAGVRWAVDHGGGIIADDVGLGKTVQSLIIAKLLKARGVRRNMIVVPKSVIANWAKEIEQWFPGSRVLMIGETVLGDKSRADTAAERNHKLHEYMQNDYDFTLISQPAFNDLDLDPETKSKYTDDDFWVQRAEKMGNLADKRVRKIREAYDQHIAGRDFQKRTDAIYFNDLGVDLLIGDEFHAYKNLFAVRNRFGESPKFLGGGGLSNRALDMQLKSRWIRETHGGKGVFAVTATPTKNSPLEIYSMLEHVAPQEMQRVGIKNSEEFLDRFCEFARGPCLQTDGTISDSLYVSGFKNMDELRELMRRHMNRRTAEDVGLKLPARDDRMHMIDMSPAQKTVYEDLRERIKEADGKDSTGDSHVFSIMDKMGKAALDLSILDPKYKDEASPKYAAVAAEVAAGVKEGGQVIFCEALPAHDKIKAALVAQGIPESEIAIFNAQTAKTGDARQKIQDQFNGGKLRAVIGNKTMEEGVNLQKGTTDIHHMDIAWEPATMQQRNGRGLRQGNRNASVRIHSYLAKGSFDGYRYQSVMAKKSWQDLLWKGGDRIENLERPTLSRDEIMVMMSADPDAARKTMSENKAIAEARYAAGKTTDAVHEFMRFQEMKHSLRSLKNKDSPAARRLAVRIDTARVRLEADKFFHAKHALNAEQPVLLHPASGAALERGTGLEMSGSKYVITHVDPAEGTVKLRLYGEAGRKTGGPALSIDDIKEAKPFKVSESEESAALGAQFAQGDADINMESIRALPEAVIREHYPAIQRRLKEGLAAYKWHVGYGESLPYLEGGQPKVAESYSAADIGKHASHELMLPLREHRAQVIAEYVKTQRERELRTEYETRRRGQTQRKLGVHFPSAKYGTKENPWGGAGAMVFGKEFVAEAHAEFERQQHEHIKEAPTFSEAARRAAPTIKVGYGGTQWGKQPLARMFARAKAEGILDQPLSTVLPRKDTGYGSTVEFFPVETWKTRMNGYGARDENVHAEKVGDALYKLALANNHPDLAAAIVVQSKPPEEAARALFRLPMTHQAVIDAAAHLSQKHPELDAMKLTDLAPYADLKKLVGEGYARATFGELATLLHEHRGEAA